MAVQTDEAMEQLMKDDLIEQGHSSDSDMDGEGEFLIDAFNDLMIEYCCETNIHDCVKIEDAVLDSEENGIFANGTANGSELQLTDDVG